MRDTMIAEVYWILKRGLKNQTKRLPCFLNPGMKALSLVIYSKLQSRFYDIRQKGEYTVDLIADIGGGKGTKGWSLTAAAELGIPATLIADALFCTISLLLRKTGSFSDQVWIWWARRISSSIQTLWKMHTLCTLDQSSSGHRDHSIGICAL